MKITSDFPGGNIVIDEIAGDTVRLHQDLRNTDGDWFYWYFRVADAAGRTIHFEFTRSIAVGARGPAVSLDAGATWNWLGTGPRNRFTYSFPAEGDPVSFCMTIPYTEADWRRFLRSHTGDPGLRPGTLCTSKKGRPVETLAFGCLHETPRHRVLIVTRHHACETMTSFALEGLVSFVLGGAGPEAARLREHVGFLAIPFIDKDGVEDGDQGKNRRPRDHNRDYDGPSLYPETAAVRALAAGWTQGRLSAALDLHCPWLLGGLNEKVYLVGSPSDDRWREQQRFSAILERTRTGPLPCRMEDNLPYGQDWNVEGNYQKGRSFANWLSDIPEIPLVTTIELPYANARGVEVNADTARAIGVDLARALAVYLD